MSEQYLKKYYDFVIFSFKQMELSPTNTDNLIGMREDRKED